jgi:hypothetical protein
MTSQKNQHTRNDKIETQHVFALIAILILFGIVGRMDYEDQLLIEQIKHDIAAHEVALPAQPKHPTTNTCHQPLQFSFSGDQT